MIHKSKGLTLIELVTVVAIVAIVASVAWPTFERYERKVTRGDGVRGLLIAANDLEECASAQGGSYLGCSFTSREIQGNQTPDGKYTLATNIAVDGSTFLITATRNAGSDVECPNFQLVINNLGQRGIQASGGNPVFSTSQARTCWNK